MKKFYLLILLLSIALVMACNTTGSSSGKPKINIQLQAAEAELITDGTLETDGINIGWWESMDDQIKWTFEITKKGEYTVLAFLSCPEEQAGSEVDVTMGDQTNSFKVRSTGSSWEDFTYIEIGKYTLSKGTHTILFQATKIAARFVCNIKFISIQM